MKHPILRAASLALCLAVCLASLAACRGKQSGEDPHGSVSPDSGAEVTTSAPRPVLPPEKLPELDHEIESDAGESLAGYSKAQLTEKWGYPAAELYGDHGFVWVMPNDLDYIIAYFDDDSYVTSMSYFYVVKTSVLAFDGDTVTLAPAAGEAEAASHESFTVPLSALGSKAQEKLSEGLTLYVTYNGTFTQGGSPAGISRADTSIPLTQFAQY